MRTRVPRALGLRGDQRAPGGFVRCRTNPEPPTWVRGETVSPAGTAVPGRCASGRQSGLLHLARRRGLARPRRRSEDAWMGMSVDGQRPPVSVLIVDDDSSIARLLE